MKYTLNTDFSSLNGPKAANWIMGFQDMAEDAFADSRRRFGIIWKGGVFGDIGRIA